MTDLYTVLPDDPPELVRSLTQQRQEIADRLIAEHDLGDKAGTSADSADERQSAVERRYRDLSARLLNAVGLRTLATPLPIVEGLLFRDSLAWLAGKPGQGKTFVAVDLACCVGTGVEWHGRRVTRGRVLYVIAEGAAGLGRRVNASRWPAAARWSRCCSCPFRCSWRLPASTQPRLRGCSTC